MVSLDDFIDGPLADDCASIRRALERVNTQEQVAKCVDGVAAVSNWRDYLLNRPPALFDYQEEVAERVMLQWEEGARRVMASLPTGGGKTRVGLWLAREQLLRNGAECVLWIAPASELVEQARATLDSFWFDRGDCQGVRVKTHHLEPVVRPSRREAGTITLCTVQLATSRLRQGIAYEPDVVVFDEAHQAAAKTYRNVIERLSGDSNKNILGLTATPGRARAEETHNLSDLFDGNLVAPNSLGPHPVNALRERGVLAQVEFHRISLPTGWESLRVTPWDRGGPSVAELSLNAARFWAVVRTAIEVSQNRRCLVFGASIAHCEALAAAIGSQGVGVEVISHEQAKDERDRKISAFKHRFISVLINKNIMSTGYDDPELGDVILASPIRSPIQWEQIVGRISRGPAVGGTAMARVWELDDHHGLHERVMAAQRFSGEWGVA